MEENRHQFLVSLLLFCKWVVEEIKIRLEMVVEHMS